MKTQIHLLQIAIQTGTLISINRQTSYAYFQNYFINAAVNFCQTKLKSVLLTFWKFGLSTLLVISILRLHSIFFMDKNLSIVFETVLKKNKQLKINQRLQSLQILSYE